MAILRETPLPSCLMRVTTKSHTDYNGDSNSNNTVQKGDKSDDEKRGDNSSSSPSFLFRRARAVEKYIYYTVD